MFQSLIPVEELTVKKKSKLKEERGCEFCSLNEIEGINKIFGKIEGKPLALFAQSPGPQENKKKKELLGPAGDWLWKELERVGLTREDFDIQNVVRCFPADLIEGSYGDYLKMRNPSSREIKCCSLHTEAALEKMKAKQILVLGAIAAKQLLGRSLPTQKIFWSDQLKARVYLVDHPAFFIRGYGSVSRLKAFRETLSLFAKDAKDTGKNLKDQFSYLKAQSYFLVKNGDSARKAAGIIRKYSEKGRTIAVDVEDDEIDGRRRIVACGFCLKPGLVYVFVFHHKDQHERHGAEVWSEARELLEDSTIKKAWHYGASDEAKLMQYEGCTPKYFYHDTLLSEYLRFPDVYAYGLDSIAERRFPEFSGYKMVVCHDILENSPDVPEAIKKAPLSQQWAYIDKKKLFSINKLSLETLRLYNGGDCDLTKRIQIGNEKAPEVPRALLRLYIDLGRVLYRMEPNGPLFDFEQHKALSLLLPFKEKRLKLKLKKLLKRAVLERITSQKNRAEWLEWVKNFNPGSHDQVYDAIYTLLDLEYPFEGKAETQKKTLLMLSREHPYPKEQIEWRKVQKRITTYVTGYYHCATLNNGRLRTKWRSTGTRTGRLASGGEKGSRKEPSVVNLQNIAKDWMIQNLCYADKRWRPVYEGLTKIVSGYKHLYTYYLYLQNLPKGEKKREMTDRERVEAKRAADVAERWVSDHFSDLMTYLILDYGQLEVRVMAQMSGDKNLMADCEKDDIHTTVGVTMTGWDAERIRHDEATRTITKNVHFGIMFGLAKEALYEFVKAMSPEDMRDRITREQVYEAFDRYFKRYPGVKRFIDRMREFGGDHKYVKTMFGLRQPLNVHEQRDEEEEQEYFEDDEGNSRGSWWGNQAINGPVQGTAHQLMECALVNLYRKPVKYEVLGVPVLEVHDALYVRVKVMDLIEAAAKIKYLLEHESLETVKSDFPDIEWKVPIVTEAKAGLRLGCKVSLKKGFTIGSFLVDWWSECHKQVLDMEKQLSEINDEAA